MSSNLAFFCLPVSRSLSPRDVSWLHVSQINISLLAGGVGQNSFRKRPPEKSLSPGRCTEVVEHHQSYFFPATALEEQTETKMLSGAEISYLRYVYDFQLHRLLYIGSPQLLLLPKMENKGTSSRQGPSLSMLSRLPSPQTIHHIWEVHIRVR